MKTISIGYHTEHFKALEACAGLIVAVITSTMIHETLSLSVFEVGDMLIFEEYVNNPENRTGRRLERIIRAVGEPMHVSNDFSWISATVEKIQMMDFEDQKITAQKDPVTRRITVPDFSKLKAAGVKESLTTPVEPTKDPSMPKDRDELQRMLNAAYRKGNQDAHEAHRILSKTFGLEE